MLVLYLSSEVPHFCPKRLFRHGTGNPYFLIKVTLRCARLLYRQKCDTPRHLAVKMTGTPEQKREIIVLPPHKRLRSLLIHSHEMFIVFPSYHLQPRLESSRNDRFCQTMRLIRSGSRQLEKLEKKEHKLTRKTELSNI